MALTGKAAMYMYIIEQPQRLCNYDADPLTAMRQPHSISRKLHDVAFKGRLYMKVLPRQYAS